MFYSQDLLGRKSALGAVWIAAHGKKLSRARIMEVSVSDTCKKLLDPAIPQALRLQAILVGGVVVVYHKQSLYLLDDCNEMLKRLTAMTVADSQAMTLAKGKETARLEAITMPDPDMMAYSGPLFPTFPSQLTSFAASGASSEATDDLFIMPSVPDEGLGEGGQRLLSLALNRSVGARSAQAGLFDDANVELQLEGLERHDYMDQPETFEVPDIFLGGMDMLQLPSPGQAAWNEEDERAALAAEGDAPFPVADEAPAEAKKRARPARRIKAIIDDRKDIQISLREMQSWIQDTSDIIIPGGRGRRTGAAEKKAPIIDFGPSTACPESIGAWPPELMALYNRCATLGGGAKPAPEEREAAEAGFGEDPALGLHMGDFPDYGADPGAVMADAGDMGAYYGAQVDAELEAGRSNPFKRRNRAASDAPAEVFDIETERLRAALNGTPGDGRLEDFLPAGPTPASPAGAASEPLTGRRRRGRSSGALLVDSEGKALSEKSSGRGRGRLSDLLAGEGSDVDLGAMLPVVGEEEPFMDSDPYAAPAMGTRKRQRQGASDSGSGGTGTYGTLSQYQLLEESAPEPTAQAPSITDSMSHSSLAFIQVLRSKFTTLESQDVDAPAELSFFELSTHLNRSEAARLFYQILVTRSHSFISASQTEAYGDIVLGRGPYL